MARIEGHNRFHRGGVQPMSRERLNELIKEYGATSQSIRKKKQG